MSFAKREVVELTTAANGSIIGYTKAVNGVISSVQYVKTDFADGVDFAITCETTGRNIWTELNVNASIDKMPRQATDGTDGAAGAFVDQIAVADERIKISITNGGDTKTGKFYVTIN